MVEMTVVDGADTSQQRVTFVVRDQTTHESSSNFTVNLSAHSTIAGIYRDVAKMASYDDRSFELWWRRHKDSNDEKLLNAESEQLVKDSELIPLDDISYNVKIFLTLQRKNGAMPLKVGFYSLLLARRHQCSQHLLCVHTYIIFAIHCCIFFTYP